MKEKIIFYAFSSQSWDSYFPIIKEILVQEPNAKNWMSVCAPCDRYEFRNNNSKDLFELFKEKFSTPPADTLQKPNEYEYALVTTHIPDERHGLNKGLYIHVPHGSAFGNNMASDYLLSCYKASNIYCGVSPTEGEYITDSIGELARKEALFVATGCPKNDMFSDYISGSQEKRNQIKHEVKQAMNIASDQAVIFIASHWTSRGILRRFGTSLIQALSTLGDKVHIIQGAHPNLWTNHVSTQTSEWIYRSLCHERDRGSASLSLGVSDASALLASDVVIGDISSIVIEAALLEKPLLLNIDKDSFRNNQTYEIYKDISVQFEGADDLMQAFMNGVEFPSNRDNMLKKVRELFGYNIGNSSKQLAKIILNAASNLKSA